MRDRRLSKDGTTEHVLNRLSDVQRRRKETRKMLDGKFRLAAENAIRIVLGETKPSLIDAVKDKDNRTADMVSEVKENTTPEEFKNIIREFLHRIELDEGRKLESPHVMWGRIILNPPEITERATIVVAELLMSGEKEELSTKLLNRIMDIEPGITIKMLDNIVKLSKEGYIHSAVAFADAFVKDPALALDTMAKTARITRDDIVISSIVEERFRMH